jgi:AcrR family transcriptional regulator
MADTRIERTWHKLAAAQIELLLEQPGKPLTVEQVLQRAGVARATFYRHFTDLDALLAWQVERELDAITASIDWSKHEQEGLFSGRVVRAVMQHALARQELFRLYLTGKAGAVPLERMFSRFYQASLAFQQQRCANLGIGSGVPLEVVCSSLSGQLIGMLRWVLLSQHEIDSEQVVAWMREMFLHGFNQFLDPAAKPAIPAAFNTPAQPVAPGRVLK